MYGFPANLVWNKVCIWLEQSGKEDGFHENSVNRKTFLSICSEISSDEDSHLEDFRITGW